MLLTPLYTAPLPAGFLNGTVEIKSPGTYVDHAGRLQQPSYRFTINADATLTNLQTGGATSIVGMGIGDRLAAPLVDVVIELYVAGSAALRTTYQMSPADSGGGTLRLQQEKQTAPLIVTASDLANLTSGLLGSPFVAIAGSDFNIAVSGTTALGTPPALATSAVIFIAGGDVYATITGTAPSAGSPPFRDSTQIQIAPLADAQAFRAIVKSGSPRLTGYWLQGGSGNAGALGPTGAPGPAGAASTVPGPAGAASTVPGPAGATGPLRNVANHAALKGTTVPATSGDSVATQGALTAGDGGAGMFEWLIAARPADDALFTIWHNTDTTGFFSRVWDGRNANYAWAALAAASTPAQHNAAFATLAGLNVELDKLYTGINASINVPANTALYASVPGRGFTADTTLNTILTLGLNVSVTNLNLDSGITSMVCDTGFSSAGMVQLSTGCRVKGLRLKNARACGIVGYNSTNIFIDDVVIDGAQNKALFTQVCFDMKISRVRVVNCLNDGIKIHTRDGAITTTQGYKVYLRDCTLDYSGVTLTADTLAVEFWGGLTTFQNNPHISGIDVTGPAAQTTGGFWGISLDTVNGGLVDDCCVDGGAAGVLVALEAAGCKFSTFRNCYVRRHKAAGLSISNTNCANITATGCTFREAIGFTGVYAIQAVTGAGHVFERCFFKDAGARNIFLNGAGNGTIIDRCQFYVSTSSAQPMGVYIAGVVANGFITDCLFAPLVESGETATAFNMGAVDGGQALNWTFRGNTLNGALASTGAASGTVIISYSGGGGHLYSGTRALNNSGASAAQYDTGPASVFDNNFCPISPRTTGTIDLLVGRNS